MELSELQRIAKCVAPDLRGTLRLECRRDDWAKPDCRAFASTATATIVFVETPTVELLIHELAHLLPAVSAETVARSRSIASPQTETALAASGGFGDYRMEMAVHGPEFVRNVLHLRSRVLHLNVAVDDSNLDAAGWAYGSPPLWQCRELLGDEPARCRWMTFAEIHATPMPVRFEDVFSSVRSFHEGLRCRTK